MRPLAKRKGEMEHQIKILIVEDEAILAMSIKRVLANLGYHVFRPVSTGEEAVQKAKQEKPDLVILDVLLGGKMDGFEVANYLRSRYDISIIFMSGFQEEELSHKIKTMGSPILLVKPFDPDDLKLAIDQTLKKHKAHNK